jgi:hypothetical protein
MGDIHRYQGALEKLVVVPLSFRTVRGFRDIWENSKNFARCQSKYAT